MRAVWFVVFALGCSSSSTPSAQSDASTPDAPDDTAVDVAHDHEIDVNVEAGAYDGPKSLSETGLYSDFSAKTVAASIIAYDVRYPLWSDGLEKSRFLLLPAGKTIDVSNPDHWSFPVGTKLWKEFRTGGRRIETRYLEKRTDTDWLRVTFGWDATESTATAMPDGAVDYGGTTHDLPDRDTCNRCHLGEPGGVLGIGVFQVAPLVADWQARGMFSGPVTAVDPPGTGNTQEVLAYFHGNCGPCHNSAGVWATANKLRLHLLVSDTTPESTGAYTTAINKMAFHTAPGDRTIIVVPGDPDHSQLAFRVAQRDFWSMPPVGTEVVDDAAVTKIRTWITSLK